MFKDAWSLRLTEAQREKDAITKQLADIDKQTVDFVENYDGSESEPSVLPSPLPSAELRLAVPDDAQEASYFAASLSNASFSLRFSFPIRS